MPNKMIITPVKPEFTTLYIKKKEILTAMRYREEVLLKIPRPKYQYQEGKGIVNLGTPEERELQRCKYPGRGPKKMPCRHTVQWDPYFNEAHSVHCTFHRMHAPHRKWLLAIRMMLMLDQAGANAFPVVWLDSYNAELQNNEVEYDDEDIDLDL